MQKITRVHLANCGYRTAWYEGLTFDLTDPNTGEPTDTVINLENGGGKTTLLGLIFSCFETSQERFLKHLQAKTASFSQYFTHDGVPGFILVEWLMPSRTAGSQPYRLVTGQAVAVRTTSDPPDVDRMFFSFEERAELSFKDIPAPGLAANPPGSMADFSRWLHSLQKQHPGNVYLSHNRQAEWQRHLKDERLIDLDMLRIQLNFSAQEGGFDAGFLDFKTEPEFLRKFLHLTSDSEKADKARAMIVAVCEKHRRKPQLEKRRDELTKFRASLNAFTDTARQYTEAFVNQRGLTIQGAQLVLVLALQSRALVRHAQRETELEFERTQRSQAGAAAKEAALYTAELMAVTWAWHQKSVAVANASGRSQHGSRDPGAAGTPPEGWTPSEGDSWHRPADSGARGIGRGSSGRPQSRTGPRRHPGRTAAPCASYAGDSAGRRASYSEQACLGAQRAVYSPEIAKEHGPGHRDAADAGAGAIAGSAGRLQSAASSLGAGRFAAG